MKKFYSRAAAAFDLGASELLHHALTSGDLKEAEHWLGKGADANYLRRDGFSALFYASAILTFNQDIMQCLLDHGADPNRGNNRGDRPLTVAAMTGCIEAMEMLVLHGADISVRNDTGTTILMKAVQAREMEAAYWLVDHGADVTVMDKTGETALSLAKKTQPFDDRQEGFQFFIRLLEEKGAPDAPPASPEMVQIRKAVRGPGWG